MNRDIPEPPTNPPEPDNPHEEHDWGLGEPHVDGVGKSEADATAYELVAVIHSEQDCRYDGCSATLIERRLIAADDVTPCPNCGSDHIYEGNEQLIDFDKIQKTCPDCGEHVEATARETKTDIDR